MHLCIRCVSAVLPLKNSLTSKLQSTKTQLLSLDVCFTCQDKSHVCGSVCSLMKFFCQSRGKWISFLLNTLMNAPVSSVSTAAHLEGLSKEEFFYFFYLVFTLHLMPRSFKPGMKLPADSQQT